VIARNKYVGGVRWFWMPTEAPNVLWVGPPTNPSGWAKGRGGRLTMTKGPRGGSNIRCRSLGKRSRGGTIYAVN